MTFDNVEFEEELGGEEPGETPPEESSNRMFLIAAGVLGAVAFLLLVCIAVYALVLLPRSRNAQNQQKATLDAQNTEVASIINATSTAAALAAIEAAYTPTPTETPIPSPTPSPTFVVAMPTETATGVLQTIAPEMATATALNATLTANALLYQATLTARPGQPTSIPETGFADEVGLPAMLGLALLLIVVIILARRLRSA
jgi:hypothetical protein